jgi:hypothetical protein
MTTLTAPEFAGSKPIAGSREAKSRPEFITDDDGRLIFYPDVAVDGFIVPDKDHETALRALAERLETFRNWVDGLGKVVAVPALAAFYFLSSSHLLLGYLCLLAVASLCQLTEGVGRTLLLNPATQGLIRVSPKNPSIRSSRRRLFTAVLAFPAIAAMIEYSYSWRVASLPRAQQTVEFYPDLMLGLFIAFVGLGLFALFLTRGAKARLNSTRLVIGSIIAGIMGFGGLLSAVILYALPTPRLTLTPTELTCKDLGSNWRATWQEIATLDIGYGRRGTQNLDVRLTKPQPLPLYLLPFGTPPSQAPSGPTSFTCEISGLLDDYHTVFDRIESEWQQHRLGPHS